MRLANTVKLILGKIQGAYYRQMGKIDLNAQGTWGDVRKVKLTLFVSNCGVNTFAVPQ